MILIQYPPREYRRQALAAPQGERQSSWAAGQARPQAGGPPPVTCISLCPLAFPFTGCVLSVTFLQGVTNMHGATVNMARPEVTSS